MTITTTIKAGDLPQTIPLPEGQSLTLKGYNGAAGVAYLLDQSLGGTNSLKSLAIGNGTLAPIGPFSGTQQLLITCTSGSIDASVGDAVVGLSAYSQGSRMAFVGDSQTARAFGGSVAGGGFYSQPFGWVKWALGLSGQAYAVGSFQATPSTGSTSYSSSVHPTTQEQLAVVLSDPTITDVSFMTGINDLQSDCPLGILTASVEPMLDAIIASGRKLHLFTIYPMNSAYGNYTVARQGVMLGYNAWLRSIVTKYGKRAELYDAYAAVADPASKTSSMKSGYSFDNLHTRNISGYAVGKMVAARWAAQGKAPIPLLSSAGDAKVDETGAALFAGSTNALQNGLFNLGSPTNGVAQNWTKADSGSASSTANIVAASSGVGNAQQLAVTFGASGDYTTLTSTNMVARIPSIATSKLRAKARITVVGTPTNLKNVSLTLSGFGSSNPLFRWSQPDTNDIALVEGFSEIMLCDLDLAQWSLSALATMTLSMTVSGVGSGSATVQISEASVDII